MKQCMTFCDVMYNKHNGKLFSTEGNVINFKFIYIAEVVQHTGQWSFRR